MSSSRLLREISPAKAFASSADKAHLQLPDLFKQKDALKCLRPTQILGPDGQPQSARDGSGGGGREEADEPALVMVPALLERLQALKEEKLAAVERVTGPQARHGTAMRVDAYRQVLDAFINSFSTYRPLLLKLKAAYDKQLGAALLATREHTMMTAQIAGQPRMLEIAKYEAQVSASSAARVARDELEELLRLEEANCDGVEAECDALHEELEGCCKEIEQLRKELEQQREEHQLAKQQLVAHSTWSTPTVLNSIYVPPGAAERKAERDAVARAAAAAAMGPTPSTAPAAASSTSLSSPSSRALTPRGGR